MFRLLLLAVPMTSFPVRALAFNLIIFVRDAQSGRLLENATVYVHAYEQQTGRWTMILQESTSANGCVTALELSAKKLFIKATKEGYLTGFYPGRMFFQDPDEYVSPWGDADYTNRVSVELEPIWKRPAPDEGGGPAKRS